MHKIPAKLDRQKEAYFNGVLDLDELKQAKQQALTEQYALEQEVEELQAVLSGQVVPKGSLIAQAKQVHRFILDDELPVEERRKALSLILDHFVWDRGADELQIFFRI